MKLDVLIPLYNCADTVEIAIASIQAQTMPDFRIIAVNDGSTDATPAILHRLAAADPRIMVLDVPNGGIVDALNAGLAQCTSPLLARHDGDDIAAPERFARQLAWFDANPDGIAVSCAVRQIDARGRPVGGIVLPSPAEFADASLIPQREPYLMHPFLMARRAAVQEAGSYRHVFHAEDTDLYWRLQESGRLHNMGDVLGWYRLHEGGVTSNSLRNGRVSAVNSQRAGISALRRRAGRPDLAFPKSALARYHEAESLSGMIACGSTDLDAAEARRLSLAACAKLLELANYRGFELDETDCRTINDTLCPALPTLPAESRDGCRRMLSGTAARLLAAGHFTAARLLAPPNLYPLVAARLGLRTMVPPALRRRLQQAAGRHGYVK